MNVTSRKSGEVATEHVIVRYPDSLTIEEIPEVAGVDLALVTVDAGGLFRPNMVFTSVPSDAPLIDASIVAILAAGEDHPGARMLSVDVFPGRGGAPSDPPVGRVIKFSYPGSAYLDVIVKKWVIATGEHHLHASASFLPSQASYVEEIFDWVAENQALRTKRNALLAAARASRVGGARVDRTATSRAGFPLEDLSEIPQTRAGSGCEVASAAAGVLADAWNIRLDQPRVFHAIATSGEQQVFYAAYLGDEGVLVLRSGGSSVFDSDSTRVQGYGLSPERLPADIAAWLGITPGFRFGTGMAVTLQEYRCRITSRSGDGAWVEVQMSATEGWLRAVYVHGEGYFEGVMPAGDAIELAPLPSGRFFDLILRRIDGVLGVSNAQGTGAAHES